MLALVRGIPQSAAVSVLLSVAAEEKGKGTNDCFAQNSSI